MGYYRQYKINKYAKFDSNIPPGSRIMSVYTNKTCQHISFQEMSYFYLEIFFTCFIVSVKLAYRNDQVSV